VVVLPLFYCFFLYLTFATLRRVGLSPAPAASPGRAVTLRDHVYSTLVLVVLTFGALVTLAVLAPFRFRAAADPYITLSGARPPWYMLAPYWLMQRAPLPAWLTGLVMVVLAFAVLLLPLWLRDRGTAATVKHARLLGIIVLALWLGFSVLGALVDRG
jgi:quinol-cytochrome oxidoreductase complex cytochrome b subunit